MKNHKEIYDGTQLRLEMTDREIAKTKTFWWNRKHWEVQSWREGYWKNQNIVSCRLIGQLDKFGTYEKVRC